MKRNNIFSLILFIESLLFPTMVIVSELFHYSLIIHDNGLVYAIITTVIYYGTGIFLLINRKKSVGNAQEVFLDFTLVLNQINSLLFIFYTENTLARVLIASWFIMTAVLVAVCSKIIELESAFYALSGILVIPICLFILFGSLLSDFPTDIEIACEVSPDKTYCAELIDHDQGALGGSTTLYVYKYDKYDKSFSIGPFEFIKGKDKKEIYDGRWCEFPSLHWEDNDHLTLNGTTYSMDKYFFE